MAALGVRTELFRVQRGGQGHSHGTREGIRGAGTAQCGARIRNVGLGKEHRVANSKLEPKLPGHILNRDLIHILFNSPVQNVQLQNVQLQNVYSQGCATIVTA